MFSRTSCNQLSGTAAKLRQSRNGSPYYSVFLSIFSKEYFLYTKRLSAVTEYIETHLDQRIQLQELADLCGISSGFLSRIFKQVYHETVVEYINRQRIYRAKKLLIETNQPVSNICVTCGFWNESYFYRIFKKSQQMSPSDFRKMHRQPFVDLDELPEYLDESN